MFTRKRVAEVVAEFLGTAVLTSVVLAVMKSALGVPYFVSLAAGLVIAGMVMSIGAASSAHYNPAITVSMWTIRKIGTLQALLYITAQFLGGLAAWRLYTYLVDGPIQDIANAQFDWRVLVAEALGAMIFAMGFAAAVLQKQERQRCAVTVSISLILGILVASIVSNGVINPAVALGVQSWSWAYVAGPIVGAVVGANLFGILFAEQSILATRPSLSPKVVRVGSKKR
jgi:glycerol uptake facilitator-like aquaporin